MSAQVAPSRIVARRRRAALVLGDQRRARARKPSANGRPSWRAARGPLQLGERHLRLAALDRLAAWPAPGRRGAGSCRQLPGSRATKRSSTSAAAPSSIASLGAPDAASSESARAADVDRRARVEHRQGALGPVVARQHPARDARRSRRRRPRPRRHPGRRRGRPPAGSPRTPRARRPSTRPPGSGPRPRTRRDHRRSTLPARSRRRARAARRRSCRGSARRTRRSPAGARRPGSSAGRGS